MSNRSEVMIYLSFLLSEFIATRRARLEAREAGFLVHNIIQSKFITHMNNEIFQQGLWKLALIYIKD